MRGSRLETNNCGCSEEQGEHGGDKLVEANAGGPRQQGAAAAEVHAAHLACQQADPQHPQRPACYHRVPNRKIVTSFSSWHTLIFLHCLKRARI